jgi:hypothetical protein
MSASLRVYQAFVNYFTSGAGASIMSGLGIAYENSPFSPTAQTPWAELRYFPNETSGLSLRDKNETTGVFSVILRYPVDVGAIVVKSKAQAIIDALNPGKVINYTGQRVHIVNSSSGSGFAEDGWYKQVVDIRFRAFSVR